MRVAVRHTDESHPNAHWFAFELGRTEGFTNPVTGESFTPEQVAASLLERARAQYPESEGYEHRVETLHVASLDENGNEVGEWHPLGSSSLPRAGQGVLLAHELEAAQGQAADSEIVSAEPTEEVPQ